MGLTNNKDFKQFLKKSYQPFPFTDYYVDEGEDLLRSVRAIGSFRRWEEISKILPKDKSVRILDIGCNAGYFGFMGAIAGHTVVGFDTDEEYIYWANEVAKDKKFSNVTFRVEPDDLLGVLGGIPDNSYDFVFYLSLHHHMCSSMGTEAANQIFQEISRIAPNMIFDMGQSNEVDNGWLTWLKKVPAFEDHCAEVVEWILGTSDYNYGSVIGWTWSHEVQRWLFYMVRDVPKDVNYSREIISLPLPQSNARHGFVVEQYLWKKRKGSMGAGKFNYSSEGFPVMDLVSDMAVRYYVVSDLWRNKFFVKEFMLSWLCPWGNIDIAREEFERGALLAKSEELVPKIVAPIGYSENFIVFPYCDWSNLTIAKLEEQIDCSVAEDILQTSVEIFKRIGVFDIHANNILYKDGNFKFVDFSPVTVDATVDWWKNRFAQLTGWLSALCGVKIVAEVNIET